LSSVPCLADRQPIFVDDGEAVERVLPGVDRQRHLFERSAA
jgi:hypothetical protein